MPNEERRDTRRRFEQWARNPECHANTISAVHNISMAEVVKREGGEPTMGQSPFAILRGRSFEKSLMEKSAQGLREALAKAHVLPTPEARFIDLRLRMSGGPCQDLDTAREKTTAFLRAVAAGGNGHADLPVVLAGATVSIPGGVMLPEAILVTDVLVARRDAEWPTLVVGEVKTYPDRAGYTHPAELALARAQAGVYVHGLRLVITQLELDKQLSVSNRGFLILTRPGYNIPSVRADEDLEYQARRAERGFQRLARIAELKVPPPPDTRSGRLDAVTAADFRYCEACVSFCDRASVCLRKALEQGDPAVLGNDMVRFLGEVSLHRALALLDGAKPANAAEADLVRRFEDADVKA